MRRSAGILDVTVEPDGADEIAGRSRGTPRIANRLLRRVRDFAEVRARRQGHRASARPTRPRAVRGGRARAWTRLDLAILTHDRREVRRRPGRPVDARGRGGGGARHGRGRGTSRTCMQLGFLKRTPRGRVATERGYRAPGRSRPAATLPSLARLVPGVASRSAGTTHRAGSLGMPPPQSGRDTDRLAVHDRSQSRQSSSHTGSNPDRALFLPLVLMGGSSTS